MNYGVLLVLFSAILIYSCDSEITGSVSSDTIPRQIETGCATDQDLAHSDCPAIELANICDPFFCRVAPDQALENEIALASDYTLPECGQGCRAMDCSTIDCKSAAGRRYEGQRGAAWRSTLPSVRSSRIIPPNPGTKINDWPGRGPGKRAALIAPSAS